MIDLNRNHPVAATDSREVGLLLACGRVGVTDRAPDSVDARVLGAIDWEIFARMAAGHGMSAIAARDLAPHTKLIPAPIIAALRARQVAISARNLYLANELVTIADLLAGKGVPAIVFKGPTLAALAYPEPGLREFSDLDILVRPAAIARARQVLIAHGYRPSCSDSRAVQSPVFRAYEETFVAASGVTVLDLHWHLLPHYIGFLDADSLWDRARHIELHGHRLTTLATEDLLLFLCVHGAKHGWPLLSWICDLAGLVHRNPKLDWQALMSRSQSVRSRRSLLLGLWLAHDLMNAEIPQELGAAARADPAVERLARLAIRAMLRNQGDRAGLAQGVIIPLQSIETARDKIRYLAHRALTPTLEDWDAMPLPAPLFPLYYLTRPLRLAFTRIKSPRRN
jgi:Uncharacterised nucleotidyltransferase